MMNKKIAAGALALTLAAGGTAAVTHTYAASASDSASKTADASVAAPKAAGTAADPLQADKGGKGPRGGPGLAGGPAAERAELAALLNLTEEQLRTQQESGKTLSAIAAEQKVDEQKLIALLVSKHQAKLAEELAAGTITQAQHDERLAEAKKRAGEKIDRVFDPSKPGAGRGPHGGPGLAGGPAAERAGLAALLNLTEEQLRTQQESGKTLSAIAAEQQVDEQKLIALLVSKHQAKLAEELAAGKITQAQHDERLAEAKKRAGEKLDRVFDAKAPHGPGEGRGPRGGPAAGAPAAPGADGNGPQPGAAAGAEGPAAAVPVPAS
ncbi:LysM peptidoglycan-binding domain-containing protein [Saccharibacillus brassicae]|uniref:LysM peptidoglycan-binding domain-containing protein n=1 Tax=Saccharibacillus brassicae TaxID=2583377 RepID=UPI00123B0192